MARTLMLLADRTDHEALIGACSSFGLHLLPMRPGTEIGNPSRGPVCFLGYLRESELHPVIGAKPRFSDAVDPLLFFARPYHDGQFLVDGQIRLNDDNKEVAKGIKPYFTKIERWLKSNWRHDKNLGAYIGPVAADLLASSQVVIRSSLAGVPIEYLPGSRG